MKDGYYLSTYVTVDALAHLVPLNQRHDSNIALFKKNGHNIELIHYWELERLTRLKHHSRAFYNTEHAKIFINGLLKPYDLTIEDMEEVWGTPQLQTTNDYHSINEHPHLMFHSIAHLFSGILFDTDIFNNYDILALAIDGVPDLILQASSNKDYYSAAYSSSGKILDLFTVSSPGNLWSFAKDHFKLQEGSLMALASASTSKAFFPQSNTLIMKNARTIMENGKPYFDQLIQFINNLEPGDSGSLFNHYDTRFSIEENHISMVMKEIQQMSIRMLEREIEEIISKYEINPQKTYLSITGGYALNCPTNSYLMNKYRFKGFSAPPCVNDSGISLGMGLYAFYKKMHPSALNFKLNHAFYGDEQTNTTVQINNHKYQSFIKRKEPFSISKIVEDIINYPIVWFNGRAEIGPRALGNRSLLGDPRHQKTKKILNEIKQRQWWRPVAPIIIESEFKNWFENSSYSPYMLQTYNILPEKASLIPAVAHLDKSARVQTINSKSNTLLYKIISKFHEKTGVPILCNTSLNDKNEPIINTIEETIIFALRKNIPVIYINGVRIELQNHSHYQSEKIDTKFEMFTEGERELLFKQMNPYQIPITSLSFYKQVIENNLNQKYDLTNHKDVKRLLREIQIYNR